MYSQKIQAQRIIIIGQIIFKIGKKWKLLDVTYFDENV